MQSVIKRKQLIKALNNDSVLCYDTDDNMILVCQALLITTAEHGFFCGSLKSFCFLLDGRLFFYKYPKYVKRRSTVSAHWSRTES